MRLCSHPGSMWVLGCLVGTEETCTTRKNCPQEFSAPWLMEQRTKEHRQPPHQETEGLHQTETRLPRTETDRFGIRRGDSVWPDFVSDTLTHVPRCPNQRPASHPKTLPLPQPPHASSHCALGIARARVSVPSPISSSITHLNQHTHPPPASPSLASLLPHQSPHQTFLKHFYVPVTHSSKLSYRPSLRMNPISSGMGGYETLRT